MRLRWANSISIFFRSRHEVAYASVAAMSRAMSRAPSWIERGILRAGAFGRQRGFSEQTSQSSLLAR
jgi:hypothetical protein